MIEFLSAYTMDEFLTFTAALIIAVMAAIKAFDYFNQRFDLFETKKTKRQRQMDELSSNVSLLLDKTQEQQRICNALLESDKCRIRAEITRAWQEHMREKKIDYFTLQYLQKQFECYRAEGGNSYVCGIMEEMESWELIK